MRRRRRSSPRARALAAIAAACLFIAACNGSIRTGSEDSLPTRDAAPPVVAPASPTPTKPSTIVSTPTSDTRGVLEIRVRDALGRARSDVRVSYRGPVQGTAVTRDGGVRQVTLPPGRYDLEVPAGCVGALEVNRGQTARAEVYPGRRSVVSFDGVVEARRRHWAGTPIDWSPEPPWPRGARATFTFLLYDRCERQPKPAPRAALDGYRFEPSRHLELAGDPPARSNGAAVVTLTLRCVAAGAATLDLVDRDTGERIDLLAIKPTFVPGTQFCG